MFFKSLAVVLLSVQISACANDIPMVTLSGEQFIVDIADDNETRARGLMFVRDMSDNKGMLFIFDTQEPRSFWMKNTKIPLDIFYFDKDLKLVSVSENTPPCRTSRCRSYPSTGPAQYVLELNAGKAAELGVNPGSQLTVQNIQLPTQ